jgi:hypothetical protein
MEHFLTFKKDWIIRNNITLPAVDDKDYVRETQDDGRIFCFRIVRDYSWYPGDGFNKKTERYTRELVMIFDEIPLSHTEYERCWKEYNRGNDKFKNWIYFTISPDKQLRGSLNMNNLGNIKEFCKNWFNSYHYSEFYYAIESGKSVDSPHLHSHALVKGVKPALKKTGHYVVLKQVWNETMPIKIFTVGKYPSKKSVDIMYQQINSEELFNMKKNYLINDLKGSHKNFVNLN